MEQIRSLLRGLAEDKYKAFQHNLIPNVDNVLGVRIPELRKIAKQISLGDWKSFLEYEDKNSFEEIMLEGLVIGYTKMTIDEHLHYVEKFVPKINNWAVCDSPVSGFKFTKKHMVKVFDFIKPYLYSTKEFEARFGVIMLLSFYIIEDYIDEVLILLNQITNNEYYVQMGIAWTVSVCYVKFPDKTEDFLKNNKLDNFTHNKSIQKISESFRVSKEDKLRIKKLIRNKS